MIMELRLLNKDILEGSEGKSKGKTFHVYLYDVLVGELSVAEKPIFSGTKYFFVRIDRDGNRGNYYFLEDITEKDIILSLV